MVFQTTSVFNTNVGAAGMALGELWLVWDFVLVCKEQTAEGLWACTKKKCLAMLRRPCLGMPKRVSPRPSMWGKPDVCLPGVFWRRSLPCLPMEPATEVRAMWMYRSSNHTSITHTSGTKIHAREDSPPLEQSRAELDEVGGCMAKLGPPGEKCQLFCLSTIPAMTYCRRWSCSTDKLHLVLTREAAQQEVEPQSRTTVRRETITWAWKWTYREDVGISSNIWASLTEAVGTCISLRFIGILGADGIISFTYRFAFAFFITHFISHFNTLIIFFVICVILIK